MKLLDILFVVVGLCALIRALLAPVPTHQPKKERFGSSDWASSFWGPTVWDGWNTGIPLPRKAPPPEPTPVFEPILIYPGK